MNARPLHSEEQERRGAATRRQQPHIDSRSRICQHVLCVTVQVCSPKTLGFSRCACQRFVLLLQLNTVFNGYPLQPPRYHHHIIHMESSWSRCDPCNPSVSATAWSIHDSPGRPLQICVPESRGLRPPRSSSSRSPRPPRPPRRHLHHPMTARGLRSTPGRKTPLSMRAPE